MALKNPNGFGSVFKLSNSSHRRNKWGVRKTAGWEINPETGKRKQIYINIGYFPTRDLAMQALANFNENPYDIKTDSITFAEVYEKWSTEHFPSLSNPASIRTIKSAYNHCSILHNMRMRDIKIGHLEGAIISADVGNSIKGKMKSMFNMIYEYSLAHDIIEKDYSKLMFKTNNPINYNPKSIKRPFSKEAIEKLWDSLYIIPHVDIILIGIYSGWRPQELATLRIKDIDINTGIMKGGLKTDAGKNRIVPIHSLIKPLIEKRIMEAVSLNSKSLFNDPNSKTGIEMNYDKYSKRFKKIMKYLNLDHKPHETRHTFSSKASEAYMDEHIKKRIMGHAITDMTERVYTHRTIEQLKEEIEKIQK